MEHRSYKLRGTADCPIAVYGISKPTLFTHWHPEVELLLVLSGTLYCQLEDRQVTLECGEILVTNPNQTHGICDYSEDLRYISVIFSLEAIAMPENHIFQRNFVGPLADGLLQLPNILTPEHPAYDTLWNILSQMRRGDLYLDDSKLFRYTQVIAICAALQRYCTLTQAADQRQAPEDRTVRKAMIFIHNLYARPLTLRQIAKHVHLHPNHLCTVFKAYTGHTVMEHLAQTRVDAAKFLLRRDSLPMARVAELSGFPSERTFYRQFRKFSGMTPKEYQKQQLSGYEG